MDNEISLEYAKHFDCMTCKKANGRYRSLSVNSHASHVSQAFLQYCWEHRIHIPCYVSHGTHIYQGLDVIVFSALKTAFGQECDTHMCETGQPITKDTFAMIYGRAHLHTMTPDIIKTAFRKTGLWPVDQTVITQEMMAPCKAMSTKVFTPIEPSTPVHIITELLIDAAKPVHAPEKAAALSVVSEGIEDLEEECQDAGPSKTALIHTPNQQCHT